MFALNQFAYGWWMWMSSMFWQVSLLVLVVSVIDLIVRKWMWPQVRYALWLLIFIKLIIPPGWDLQTGIVTGVMPGTREYLASRWESTFQEPLAMQPGAGQPGMDRTALDNNDSEAAQGAQSGRGEVSGTQGAGGENSGKPAGGIPIQTIFLLIWLAGIAFYSILLASRIRKLRRWHQEQKERKTIPGWFHEILVETGERLGLHELPAIVFSDEAVTPAVYGVFRPVLLLPAKYIDALSRDEARHVLMHELAHLKRGDLWVHGATMLLQIVYWFNPLLLWSARQVKHVREICCDLTIAGYLREETDGYRKTLLDTARELLTQSFEPGMGLLGVFEEPFWLVARIRWLEKRTWEKRRPIAAGVILLFLIMVPFVLPMAASGPENFAGPALTADGGEASGGAGDLSGGTTAAGGGPEEAAATEPPGTPPVPQEKAWLVKDITRLNQYVLWYLRSSSLRSTGEVWFGDGKISMEDNDRRYILDRDKNIFIVINYDDGSYFESRIPVDPDNALGDDLKWRYQDVSYDGEVKKTRSKREYLGRECTKFRITTWELRGDIEGDAANIEVWTATDMPFDLSLFHDLMDIRRELSPRTPGLIEQMRKVEGVQMHTEIVQKKFPFTNRYVTKVVEIAEKTVPEGTFEVPDGYSRKDRLEPGDLR